MTIKTLDSYKIEKSGKENRIFVEVEKNQIDEDSPYCYFTMGSNYSSFSVEGEDVYILKDLLDKVIKYYEEVI